MSDLIDRANRLAEKTTANTDSEPSRGQVNASRLSEQEIVNGVSKVVDPDKEPPSVVYLCTWLRAESEAERIQWRHELHMELHELYEWKDDPSIPGERAMFVHVENHRIRLFLLTYLPNATKPQAETYGIVDWHQKWAEQGEHKKTKHPIRGIVEAWHKRPKLGTVNMRDGRIMPARAAIPAERQKSRRQARLFSKQKHGDQATLPGFESTGSRLVPGLPLQLFTLGVNAAANGTGAALALRCIVEGILASSLEDRGDGQPIALEIEPWIFLGRLYPNRKPRRNEWRAALWNAREALASNDAAIRWEGGWRWPVTITNIPEHSDDAFRLVVDLPEGAKSGPQVSDNLHLYGPKNKHAYHALINLPFWWHDPGVTVIPVRKGPGGKPAHWQYVKDASKYRRVTDDELIAMVFPEGPTWKNRSQQLTRAQDAIERLEKDGELRICGKDRRILMPPVLAKPDSNPD